ncbi:MAG: InlB B-repeat-containing protein [Clostridia bacterium]|nr:InlB B-repeat-containing protein [Clostridia bacterium]
MKKVFLSVIILILSSLLLISCDSVISSVTGIFGQGEEPDDNTATVTFDTQGGTPEAEAQVVEKGTRAKRATWDPSKKGYTFLGWYNGDHKWSFLTEVTEDITLTAKYSINEYEITYDLDGGVYDGELPLTYTVEDNIVLGTPTKENCIFMGWKINGEDTNVIPKGTVKNLTVVADFYGLEGEALPAYHGAKGIVALVHDDARLETMEIMDGLLQKYGLVGDVAFILNKVYKNGAVFDEEALAGYRSYINNGRWKIVNHSATHNWWGMESQNAYGAVTLVDDPDRLEYEVVTSQEKMRELFPGQRVLTFAYPGFSWVTNTYGVGDSVIYSDAMRRLVEKHHISGRITSGDKGQVNTAVDWNWFYGRFFSQYMIENELDSILKDTVNNGKIHILSFHALTTDPTLDDDGYSILDTYMDQALAMLEPYVDSGEIWNTHYEDAILYVREAQTATVKPKGDGTTITVQVTDEMDDEIYNHPLTIKLALTDEYKTWKAVKVVQGDTVQYAECYLDGELLCVNFDALPDSDDVIITEISLEGIPE